MPHDPDCILDVTINTQGLSTQVAIRLPSATAPVAANGNAADLEYFVHGRQVPREDFRAVVEIHAFLARIRLAPV